MHAVPETLTLDARASSEGDPVNVEPAVRAGEPLGGHYVQGHVDGVGRVQSVEAEGDGLRVFVEAPENVLRYCVEKGSVTVDGVSLTVAELGREEFAVALVPHTLEATTLSALAPGQGEPRGRRAREVRGAALAGTRDTIRGVSAVKAPEAISPFSTIDAAIEDFRSGSSSSSSTTPTERTKAT